MAILEQYGFGVQLYGVGGFGGWDEALSAPVFAEQDTPVIAWNNLLTDGNYLVTVGSESAAAPLARAWNSDMLSIAEITPGTGVFQFQWLPKYTVTLFGFGDQLFGEFGFGGLAPKSVPADTLIFGASRHDSAGYRSQPSKVTLFAESGFGESTFGQHGFGGSVILDQNAGAAANVSHLVSFEQINTVRVTVTLYGLPALAYLPEIFLGQSIHLPWIDLGFDPYHEVFYGSTFVSESGREYPQMRYRRLELSPRWSFIPQSLFADIQSLRENCIELKKPFWFSWMPASLPDETYFMREDGKSLPFNYVSGTYRALAPKLVEAL